MNSRQFTLCLFLALFLVVSSSLQAQSVTGYSSLDWDSVSSTLTGYSETDLDADASAYYSAYVRASLQDQNGNFIASGAQEDNEGSGEISINLSAPGNLNSTYTLTGFHEGLVARRSEFVSMEGFSCGRRSISI